MVSPGVSPSVITTEPSLRCPILTGTGSTTSFLETKTLYPSDEGINAFEATANAFDEVFK